MQLLHKELSKEFVQPPEVSGCNLKKAKMLHTDASCTKKIQFCACLLQDQELPSFKTVHSLHKIIYFQVPFTIDINSNGRTKAHTQHPKNSKRFKTEEQDCNVIYLFFLKTVE